ncbi:hypothetical protein JHK87_021894 [Glycine soja]|nr:hypothetical protein JHK87_021894 [Glycine soja]
MSYLDSMHELRIPVEDDSYVALIRFCEWKRARKEGSRVYSYVSISMSHLSLQLGNSFLSMFVRFGNLVDAWYVFGRMEKRNLFSWNVLVGGYAKAGFFDEALDLYHRMLWVGVKPDEAETVFSRMECRDVVLWTAMISGYENCLMPQKAIETFKMMNAQSIMPDEITIAIVLSACSCLCNLDMGMNLHEVAKQTGLISYAIVANSLIDMYAKCKCIDKALEVFHSTLDNNIVSWTSIILGLWINNWCFVD